MKSEGLGSLTLSEEQELSRLLELEAASLETDRLTASLTEFVKAAWPLIEPATPLEWNWHLDALILHLTLLTEYKINKLIINVPPGSLKSSIVSVLWPCWVWAREAHLRFLFASYAENLALRDSVKRRMVIRSDWFQPKWPIKFLHDNNQKGEFQNEKLGHMISLGAGGVTGWRGDILVQDDPNNATQMESEVQRESTLTWVDQQWSTRGNKNARELIIQQRTHERDVTGHLLTQMPGKWTHLKIPMLGPGPGTPFWADPRKAPDEPLFPSFWTAEKIDEVRRRLGPYGWAGQMQQEPAPAEGGIIKRAWVREYPSRSDKLIDLGGQALFDPMMHFRFCTIDPATGEKELTKNNKPNDPDYFAIGAWCIFMGARGPFVVLLDAIHERLEGPEHEPKIEAFHEHWKFALIGVESIGFQLELFQRLRRKGLPVREISSSEDAIYRVDKDKVARAYASTPLMADGRFYVPMYAPWLGDYMRELTRFPNASHDDFVDMTTSAVAIAEKVGRSLIPEGTKIVEKPRPDDTMMPEEQDVENKWSGFTVPRP